jgi:hypothetical protein
LEATRVEWRVGERVRSIANFSCTPKLILWFESNEACLARRQNQAAAVTAPQNSDP